MASAVRAGLALAALAAGGSALSLSPFDPVNGRFSPNGAQDVCGSKFVGFEHLDEDYPLACIVYCVPQGACVEKARSGGIHDKLKLEGEGNCKRRGFDEHVELGNITEGLQERLESIGGVCKGMKLIRFRRSGGEEGTSPQPPERIVHAPPPGEGAGDDAPTEPAPTPDSPPASMPEEPAPTPDSPPAPTPEEPALTPDSSPALTPKELAPVAPPAAPTHGACEDGLVPFRAIKRLHSHSLCSVYCLPEGRCQNLAIAGRMLALNISAEGTCHGAGYTQPAGVDRTTVRLQNQAKAVAGPCRGMTVTSYLRPGPDAQATGRHLDGRVCKLGTMAYEAHNPLDPNSCGLYCVPSGECEGLVQTGTLKLGVTIQGNCKGRGFTEPSASYGAAGEATFAMVKGLTGPCKGMTYEKYERPLQA